METDTATVALRRSHQAAAAIELDFGAARLLHHLAVDQSILAGASQSAGTLGQNVILLSATPTADTRAVAGTTLKEFYDAYMSDPTRDWSPRTRLAYNTTRRLTLSILGGDTPVRSITRAQCRDLIEVLRWLPRNSSKLFPGLSPVEVAAKDKASARTDLISPSNLNTYLNKLCGVFNWAVKEELIDRNPTQGLKVPDPTLRRDKRLPFSTAQLRAIFAAPLYTGCQDDRHGYAKPGLNHPRNGRFWIPLISLYGCLRLNEPCQLDVSDIKAVDGITCFVVREASEVQTTDKRLKTASSERLVPIHPELLKLGLMALVAKRTRERDKKLFGEIGLGATGYRSATLSSWFARFVAKVGGSSSKTR